MKKIYLFLLSFFASQVFAQWMPTQMRGEQLRPTAKIKNYYNLDLKQLRNSLSKAEETGKNAVPVIINLPTLEGKIEKFAVYSFPVMEKSLAEQYQLGSYVGVGVDDPSKYIRFSVSPTDFQSMLIKNGKYEFIEPQDTQKRIYGVHAKTTNTGDEPFVCSTNETPLSKEKLKKLFKNGTSFAHQPTNFSKPSDKKYRTLRLAISTTGEYTTYFGGLTGALTQINATMTRVNGIFENDFSLHLNVQNFPTLIYTDAATDPYSPASTGVKGKWNRELMQTLHTFPGDAAFDIGHLFGASGGGGNAGCIGCVCTNVLLTGGEADDSYKGAGFTSPADKKPFGDNFDIDYVAHEMGHQVGANHTFSFDIEGTGVNIEPGSGSTIMGYAGITNEFGEPITDVQNHSDPYFSVASLIQVQDNLATRTCATVQSISNDAPVIAALPKYTIPKGTAFVLTASATDAQNDPLTYTWEEVDDAQESINEENLGQTYSGASFRSIKPSANPVRYFPMLTSVLNGNLDNSLKTWESVSMVARPTNFMVTVRDNHVGMPGFQQNESALQEIVVGNDGPFAVLSNNVYKNSTAPLVWDVASTNISPYNVSKVMIDYTVDEGNSWKILSASTANDGTENFNFPTLASGSTVKIRIAALNNVFYTIKALTVLDKLAACDGSAPKNVSISNITSNSAVIYWDPIENAKYVLRYRKFGTSAWTNLPITTNTATIYNLEDNLQYEIQVAAVCSETAGTFSASQTFTTLPFSYCSVSSSSSKYEYISKVEVLATGQAPVSNTSGASNYTSFLTDPAKTITLKANSTGNTINVTKSWTSDIYEEAVFAWIDFNRNSVFEDDERIMASQLNTDPVATATFSVPASVYTGAQPLAMRVILSDKATQPSACSNFNYGEAEDYPVSIMASLGIDDVKTNSGVTVYPNPATDILTLSKTLENAFYEIYNTAGQLVDHGKLQNNQIKISKLISGVYVLSLKNKENAFNIKFIKK